MRDVFICDAVRTPIGRYGGALAKVRADDLAARPDQGADRAQSQGRLVGARRGRSSAAPTRPARTTATSRAWRCCWPDCRTAVPGVTVNRLCASGLNAVGEAARAIRSGEIEFAIAGGVESMTRAPLVMGKATEAFQRSAEIYDTTIGWRFINPLMKAQYGVDSMGGDRRERRRGIPGVARRTRTPSRCARSSAPARPWRTAISPRRSSPVEVPGGKAGPDPRRQGRASAARHHARAARQAAHRVPQPRHGDGRQCLRRQ